MFHLEVLACVMILGWHLTCSLRLQLLAESCLFLSFSFFTTAPMRSFAQAAATEETVVPLRVVQVDGLVLSSQIMSEL